MTISRYKIFWKNNWLHVWKNFINSKNK